MELQFQLFLSTENVHTFTPHAVTTVGAPGTMVVEPLSEHHISVAGSDVHPAFLISERTPVSLLGRDLLYKYLLYS